MNKFPALLTAALLLGSCAGSLGQAVDADTGRLDACTAEGSPFETLPFSEWIKTYHETVDDVVESHVESLRDINTTQLQCTADDYASLVKPTDALFSLAASLPAWESEVRKKALSETEIGPVLLEYVRVYECALNERRNYLSIIIPKEWRNDPATSSDPLSWLDADRSATEQQRMIDHELLLARPALDRTLLMLGGYDRLRPLSLDIECLKRTSLDIRNILGLVSQATACLPRIRDARGSLRDLPDLPTP